MNISNCFCNIGSVCLITLLVGCSSGANSPDVGSTDASLTLGAAQAAESPDLQTATDQPSSWQIHSQNGQHLVKTTHLNHLGEIELTTLYEHDFVGNTSRTYKQYPNDQEFNDSSAYDAITYYDEDGNITRRETYFSDGGLSDTSNYLLDGDLVVENTFGFGIERFEYNENGVLTGNATLSSNEIRSESVYVLNATGRPNNASYFNYDRGKADQGGNPSSRGGATFEFNDSDQISTKVMHGNARFSKQTFMYDEHGNIVRHDYYSHADEINVSYIYEYEPSPKPRVNLRLLQLKMWL